MKLGFLLVFHKNNLWKPESKKRNDTMRQKKTAAITSARFMRNIKKKHKTRAIFVKVGFATFADF